MNNDAIEPGDPIQRAIDLLREPVAIAPGLGQRTERRRRQQRWTRRATQGISLLLVAGIVGVAARQRLAGTTITFSIAAPDGRSVAVVGDFTDWRSDRVQLQRASSGLWRATIKLPPGRYRFAYLIDESQWRADAASAVAPDDYGRPTSVLTVVAN